MFWPYGDVLRMPFTKGISLFEKNESYVLRNSKSFFH